MLHPSDPETVIFACADLAVITETGRVFTG